MKSETKEYLFEDVKPVEFTQEVRLNKQNDKISGNVRLQQGKYRTDEEKTSYINESLERKLP